jgi:hypothetical protein
MSAVVLAIGSGFAAGARADDGLGLYVGGSVGVADVRSNGYANVDYYGFDQRHAGWKLFTGIRPIAPLGLELEYLNFGHPSSGANYSYLSADSEAQAVALFAVGYLPLPLPFLDVFAKVGPSRLYQKTTVYYPTSCSGGGSCPQYSGVLHQDIWTTSVAYSGGLQAKFGNLAVRAEYERIGSNSGEPDLISVGASWTF